MSCKMHYLRDGLPANHLTGANTKSIEAITWLVLVNKININ